VELRFAFDPNILEYFMLAMLCFAAISMGLGIFSLDRALAKAANGNGVGMVA
jgi:hypothetical protein